MSCANTSNPDASRTQSNSSLLGWELISRVIENDVKKKEDVLIAFIHLILVNNRYHCIGLGDSKTLSGNEKPSELLPGGWNSDLTCYTLRYVNDGKVYLFKGLIADDDLVINLLSVEDCKVSSVAFNVSSTVKSLKGDSLKDVIPNFDQVIKKIRKELITFSTNTQTVTTQTCQEQQRRSQTSPTRPDQHNPRQPDLAGPPDWSARFDPFEYGHADLDPLGRGRGPGMIFDPVGPRHPPIQPGLGIPGGPLPRGAVPPGARYDPMGPPDLDRRPRPRFPPDSDHMPPPGYEDMFM